VPKGKRAGQLKFVLPLAAFGLTQLAAVAVTITLVPVPLATAIGNITLPGWGA
jgi:hypothetical protein